MNGFSTKTENRPLPSDRLDPRSESARIMTLNPEKLAEIQARAEQKELVEQTTAALQVLSAGVSLRSAIERFSDGGEETRIDIVPNLWVMVGGEKHGIWVNVERRVEGIAFQVEQQVTNWVLWRSAEHASGITTDTFGLQKLDDTITYDLMLVDADGVVHRTNTPLETAQSLNPLKVLGAMNAGVVAPPSARRDVIESVLLALGYKEQERRVKYRRGGWLDDEGTPVFIEPAGAITPHGISDRYPMEDIIGASHHSGARSTDIDPVDVEDMLRRLFALAPTRPDVIVGSLGAVGAAPLALRTRTSFHLVGTSGFGKSTIMAAVQRIFTTPDRVGKFNMDFDDTSKVGAANIISQLPLVTFDDFRFNDGSSASDDFAKFQTYAQGVYQQKSPNKGQQTGRARETNYGSTQAMGLSTSETMPMATGSVALIRRLVVDRLKAGEVDIKTARNEFIGDPDLPGDAVWGAYVRSLATDAQRVGLTKWVAENNAQPSAIAATWKSSSHATATVSILAAGWARFSGWLRSVGVDIDRIIAPAAVDAAFQRLLDEADEYTTQANPIVSIMRNIREQLSAGTAHATLVDGEVPTTPGVWGWTRSGDRWAPNGKRIAYINDEAKTILITMDAIQTAKKAEGFTALERDQIDGGLDAFPGVLNDRESKTRYDKTAPGAGFLRKAGVILPVSWVH